MGETGIGKTFLIELLAMLINVEFQVLNSGHLFFSQYFMSLSQISNHFLNDLYQKIVYPGGEIFGASERNLFGLGCDAMRFIKSMSG